MYTLLMYDKKYDIIHIENHKYFGFQKHVRVLQPIGAALTCLLTISFGGGLEITQFYLTPDTVLYNGPNITLLQGRSTFWTKLALLLLTKSDNSKHVTFSIYTLFINKLSFLQRMQFKQFWKKKKIFISNSPSYFDLASQHLSINVINSTCSVGETTTLQSLVHHVCKVSKLADCVQRVGEKCNKMSVILLTFPRMLLWSYLFIIFFFSFLWKKLLI